MVEEVEIINRAVCIKHVHFTLFPIQLRAAVADLPKPEDDDYFYLRWLRARKFNLKKSEEMLRKARGNKQST